MNLKITKLLVVLCLILFLPDIRAQDITFTFANAENTNDGVNDYYEVDVLIESTSDFKLGVGLLYFNYNTAAFGTNVQASGNLTITTTSEGYILNEFANLNGLNLNLYNNFLPVDNISSRFAFSWNQAFSEVLFAGNNVTGTAKNLFHIKIKYEDVGESPNLIFEDGSIFDDQTYTACGGAFGSDCINSPGTQITSDSYDSSGAVLPATSTTWDGSESSDWTNADNWSDGVPTASLDVVIANAGTPPVLNTTTTVKSLTINSGGSLTVTGNSSGLTSTGDLTNNGTLTINSGSSLIVNGASTGNIAYNRNLATTNWYLISSPVVGQDIDDFVIAESLPLGTGSNRALATYNNGTASWDYYQDGTSNADVFTSGEGRSIKLSTIGDINFTGTMNTSDVAIELIDGASNEFNLIGNPYPSYLAVNDLADATNNLFRANGTNGAAGNDGNIVLAEDTIWLWDQSLNAGTGAYTQINLVSSKFIAPGQGFFVKRTTDAGTLNFNFRENMQSHQTTDDFRRPSNANERPEIKLMVSSNSNSSTTEMYFIEGTTLGFDNGYDSTVFPGATNDFIVYTHLVNDSQGENLGIQSVPNQDHESIVFPVGLNATSGTEITFSAESINIPNGLDVIIEDRLVGVYTNLAEANDHYSLVLNEDQSGIGRFYVHVNTMNALSTNEFSLESISMYVTDARNLRITGIKSGETSLKMFSITGQEVMQTTFYSNTVNDIALPSKLRTGIYIINMETAKGSLQKKIVLK